MKIRYKVNNHMGTPDMNYISNLLNLLKFTFPEKRQRP